MFILSNMSDEYLLPHYEIQDMIKEHYAIAEQNLRKVRELLEIARFLNMEPYELDKTYVIDSVKEAIDRGSLDSAHWEDENAKDYTVQINSLIEARDDGTFEKDEVNEVIELLKKISPPSKSQ